MTSPPQEAQARAEAAITESKEEAVGAKAARKSALTEAGVATKRCEEAEASLKELLDEWAAQAQQLQLREDDLKARKAKLANHDSELVKVVAEQATECGRLETLQRGVTEAQQVYAKHVSEANTNLDAREKKIQADTDAKAAADYAAFSSLELRAHQALSSICSERFEAPLAAHGTGYAEISSKLVEEFKDATQKVDGILEEECRDLFSMAATHVFSHLLLRNPGFNFSEVIGPVPEESRDVLVEAVESHVNALLGKFSCSSDEEPGKAEAGEGNGGANLPPEVSFYHPAIDGFYLAEA